MSRAKKLLGLDVGTVRVGVALADMQVGIAIPQGAIAVDGTEREVVSRLVVDHDIDQIVIGYPRNQSGEATSQSSYVERVAKTIEDIAPIVFQDESLTSVVAEQRLKVRNQPYSKEDIDAEAAVVILEDYMEIHR